MSTQVMQHIEVLVVMNERHDGRAGEKTYKRKFHLLVIFHNCQNSVNCVQDAHGHNRFVLYFLIFFTLKYFTKYFSLWKKPTNLTFKSKLTFLISHAKPRQLMQEQQWFICKSCQRWKMCSLLLKEEYRKLRTSIFLRSLAMLSHLKC